MRPPVFVRPLTAEEQQILQEGLRNSDAFVVRRCQILRASAQGQHAAQIAARLGCSDQTVRNVVRAFHQQGLGCLKARSSRPWSIHAAFDPEGAERLRDLLHQSPRQFGHPTSLWTLGLAAKQAQAQGITQTPVTGETVRATLARLGVRWRRAKEWISSPDPAYARKKRHATG